MGVAMRIRQALAAAGLALAQAAVAATQPAVIDSRPGVDAVLEGRGWIALRLAAPLAEPPQALCDIWGLRSAVPVEVAQGANRRKLLEAAGVAAAERDLGLGRDHTLYAYVSGVVKFEGGRGRQKVSVYPVTTKA